MKKGDIFNLANNGVLNITANELDAAHAYKVVKFKRDVKNAFDAIIDTEKDFLKEVGLYVVAQWRRGSPALWRPSYGEGRCHVGSSHSEEGT